MLVFLSIFHHREFISPALLSSLFLFSINWKSGSPVSIISAPFFLIAFGHFMSSMSHFGNSHNISDFSHSI